MTGLEIVRLVADRWTHWQDEEGFPFSPDHCINGTRVAIAALGHFDVPARPVSVQFVLFNAFAWDLHERGVPTTEWPAHAWSIGVGPNARRVDAERFNGHLVAEGAGFVLDISARQYHRPGRIEMPTALVLEQDLPREGLAVVDVPPHQTLLIGRWDANNKWRRASGWRRSHATEINELVRRVQRALDERNT